MQSNKESGYGRYDICLIPQNHTDPAMVLEFKVHDPDEEKTLSDTVTSALKQIEEKAYDAVLLDAGVGKKRIHHYGFACTISCYFYYKQAGGKLQCIFLKKHEEIFNFF